MGYNDVNEIVFKETNLKHKSKIETYLQKVGLEHPLYPILQKRLEIMGKIKERREMRDYSADISFALRKRIESGYSYSDFNCVKNSRKKNWIDPVSMLSKGYHRNSNDNDSYIIFDTGKYSSRVKYTKYEYAPRITSYIYYTSKRVIVVLEDKVYRCRNAGKYFHFNYDDKRESLQLTHTETDVKMDLTALDIIKHLPSYRREIYNLIKRNKK